MISLILTKLRWNGLSPLHQRRHTARIMLMLNAIIERFPHLKHPEQVKLKHLRWLHDAWLAKQGFADATRSDYRRSMALLVAALGGGLHWQSVLKMTKDPRKGGRPETCKAIKTQRRS